MTDHVPCIAHGTARSAGWISQQLLLVWKAFCQASGNATAITMVKAVDNAEQVGLASVVLPSVQTKNTAVCILHADLPLHLCVY